MTGNANAQNSVSWLMCRYVARTTSFGFHVTYVNEYALPAWVMGFSAVTMRMSVPGLLCSPGTSRLFLSYTNIFSQVTTICSSPCALVEHPRTLLSVIVSNSILIYLQANNSERSSLNNSSLMKSRLKEITAVSITMSCQDLQGENVLGKSHPLI